MEIERLYAIGKELGMTGAELKRWIDTEIVRERDQRAQHREDAKAQALEAEAQAEQERLRLEAEERVLKLKIELQEKTAGVQSAQSDSTTEQSVTRAAPELFSPHKLIPPFNEARDDLDAYLQRFERVATSQEWPRAKWALSLSLCLTGEALTVIGRLDSNAALDYDQLKATLLQRFRCTAEGYREKFRNARPEDNETGLQYAGRISGYFDHWLEMSHIERTFDSLRDTMIAEQFLRRCSASLRVFLKERNYKGNRYILTMVDFATRYPDAVALPSTESRTVAEGLVEMFSRVGLPREIVSDRGSYFMSAVMKEFSRLLSIKQLPTTPYHPNANGLVERFNGTLKRALGRMCQERPKCWDRYLGPLLFAYREVPQSSIGYSPFELLYGRYVRGPMAVLKELWTNPRLDNDMKSSYEYIMKLRQRLERTCAIAMQELTKAKQQQKTYYDRKAKMRELNPGDKVLVLLPGERNKLILMWKGPFNVVERKSPLDYVVDLGSRTTVFHINTLKKYEERPNSELLQVTATTVGTDDATGLELAETTPPYPSLIRTQTSKDVVISNQLTMDQRLQVEAVLTTYDDIFSDLPGKTDVLQCHLELTTTAPIQVRQYPMPFAVRNAVEKEVQDMLKLGIIEKSKSAYQAPIVVVKKKDGTVRLCIDFRKLIQILVPDCEPIPRAELMFARLTGSHYFSKFDFTKGYWQVPMAPESKEATAFSCDSGLYQFKYMPFGIKTAPAVFNRLMREVVGDIPHVYYYFDDFLVATKTWEEHLKTLNCLFHRVRTAKLTIKPNKSEIGSPTTCFLGHVVGQGVLQPLKDTANKINTAKRPGTKKELRAFLGLTGYYRDFVPNYAELAHPLTDLTKKGSPNRLNWQTSHEEAFMRLKELLSQQPILKAPDLSRHFVLRTDASSRSLGAVLLQEHDGRFHPVSYASRKLLPREAAYSTIERECLAIVWAVQKFHVYLYGKPFTLQSDHQPLRYLNSAKHVNSRVLRWSLLLMDYDFHVEYIRGCDNVGADYLSRIATDTD
ncbi:uncharacterized protein [Dermacentor andersoni]|uniref:uncharacterized protein n=1 Tax=Dermacentor andersoni TaxID=34620 RepID=UPI002155923A|nr:uncharacterized protein LOC126543279 [Dermacentor andersoni]